MIRRVITDPISWALLAVCLVLAVMLAVQVTDAPEADVPQARLTEEGVNAAASVGSEPVQFPPLTAYQEIVERPLFNRDRRPPPAPVGGTALAATVAVPQYQLEGTVLSPGGSFAILQDLRKRELKRLGLGERLDAWTIAEIGEGWLRLEHGERSVLLQLDLPGAETAAAVPMQTQGNIRGAIAPR